MSLELSFSDPKLEVFCSHRGEKITLCDNREGVEIGIPTIDMCGLIVYFLTNTDLNENDLRIWLVEKIKAFKIIDGYNPGKKRLDIKPVEEAAQGSGQNSTGEYTPTNKAMDEIKPCSRLADCACVRIEGACRGVSCGVYNPA